jgi:ATP-dependent protease Clp ATPase subunit
VKELRFLEINAAQITKEGTAGNSLSKALSPLIHVGNKPIVIFVDEFDKLFIAGNSNSQIAHESTTAVQNEFLKVLESETASVYNDYGKYATVPMSNTLFVFAGAFNNEPDITLDRLRDFGVKTEFLGRVGLIYNTKPLTLNDLYIILEKSELLDTYLNLFPDVNRADVVTTIKGFLKETYDNNTLGARSINTMIHQYFIKGGKLEGNRVKEVTFQKKLNFND